MDLLQDERLRKGTLEMMPLATGRVPLRRPETEQPKAKESRVKIDEIPSVQSFQSKAMEFAVQRLVACGAVTAITGDSGAGKTTFATALGAHLGVGADFMGRECAQRKVLILDRENSLQVVNERLVRLGIQDGSGSGLLVWGSWLEEEAPEPGASVVLEWVESSNPKPLVIVDSLIAFLKGDENDSNTVRTFMHQMRRLADLGAAVIVLHHSGKGDTSRDYRGSSDFKAAIDIGYSLTNLGDGKLDKLRLHAFKNRFTVDSDLILRYEDGEFTSDDAPGAVHRTVTVQLSELLQENPGCSAGKFEKLAAAAGLTQKSARDFLKEGVKTGFVTRKTAGRNNEHQYFLSDSYQEESPNGSLDI